MPTYEFVIETSGDGETWMPYEGDAFGTARTPVDGAEGAATAASDVLEECLDNVPDEEVHGYWRCVLWSGVGSPQPPIEGAAAVATWESPVAVWSVVRGDAATPDAIHPAPAGLEVPDEVLSWAMDEGFDANDGDMRLMVTLSDHAKPIPGEMASMHWPATRAEADIIRGVLDA